MRPMRLRVVRARCPVGETMTTTVATRSSACKVSPDDFARRRLGLPRELLVSVSIIAILSWTRRTPPEPVSDAANQTERPDHETPKGERASTVEDHR